MFADGMTGAQVAAGLEISTKSAYAWRGRGRAVVRARWPQRMPRVLLRCCPTSVGLEGAEAAFGWSAAPGQVDRQGLGLPAGEQDGFSVEEPGICCCPRDQPNPRTGGVPSNSTVQHCADEPGCESRSPRRTRSRSEPGRSQPRHPRSACSRTDRLNAADKLARGTYLNGKRTVAGQVGELGPDHAPGGRPDAPVPDGLPGRGPNPGRAPAVRCALPVPARRTPGTSRAERQTGTRLSCGLRQSALPELPTSRRTRASPPAAGRGDRHLPALRRSGRGALGIRRPVLEGSVFLRYSNYEQV
jgi:hypothetical protein